MTGLSKRRWLPRVSYHRYVGVAGLAKWPLVWANRRWGGRLWNIGVGRHQITLDFRGDWLQDMGA